MSRKTKHSIEFKLNLVNRVIKRSESINLISRETGVNSSQLRKWCNFYEHYGLLGLTPRINKSYNFQFKVSVLKAIEDKNLSLSKACILFNIPSQSTIIKWQRKLDKDGLLALSIESRGRASPNPIRMTKPKVSKKSKTPLTREEELLLELESVRAENAVLKKLYALIQQEKQKNKHL